MSVVTCRFLAGKAAAFHPDGRAATVSILMRARSGAIVVIEDGGIG
ncbi:hypothetical protein [Herbaspirillum sp. NPDC087042]